ncbi:MAG: glycosyltransferase family 39 protein [Candidatus Bathyarchaeota archaeon]|nr:glycosyltransferase family 39 protein [Candidatus Bathyarchaeota archaeon]
MIGFYLLPFLCFLPGILVLYFLSMRYRIKLSLPELIVLGSLIWNYLLVSCGYLVGIFSDLTPHFFVFFTIVSLLLSVLAFISIVKSMMHSGNSFHIKLEIDKIALFILLVVMLFFISSLVLSHSLFAEYDALFLYLPRAKSILLTGGLQYDYFLQSTLVTISHPAMPLLYAWLGSFGLTTLSFDMSVRVFPIFYISLTSVTVYLLSKTVTNDYKAAFVGAISFVSMPIVLVVATNYSLYLDIPFVFFISLLSYIILKIHKTSTNSRFWWLMLGAAFAILLLQKDVGELLALPLLTLSVIPFLPIVNKKSRILFTVMLSVLFVVIYNFFPLWDIFHYPLHLLSGYLAKQAPVFFTGLIFGVLVYRMLPVVHPVKMRNVVFLFLPFVPVVCYWLRNTALFGVPSKLLIYFNPTFAAAESLKVAPIIGDSLPGGLSSLPSSIFGLFRLDVLFGSLNLGAFLLVPCVVGFGVVLYCILKNNSNSFMLLSLFMMMFCLWSWAFNCNNAGPEVRRLLYFAPFLAVFSAVGVKAFSNLSRTYNSMSYRFIAFVCFSLLYLWIFKFDLASLTINQIRSKSLSIGAASVEMLLIFAFFFAIFFYPFPRKLVLKRLSPKIMRGVRVCLPFMLVIILLYPFVTVSFAGLTDVQNSLCSVSSSWENNLPEVISYVNQNLTHDNLSIVTCYALPVSYFTSHPVIDMTSLYGLVTLHDLSINNSAALADYLLDHNVGYFLFPKPNNSYYESFTVISNNLNLVNKAFFGRTPAIKFLQEFSKFELYKVISSDTQNLNYRYLTTFDANWTPINDFTVAVSTSQGLLIRGTESDSFITPADYPATFWTTAKSDSADVITLSNSPVNEMAEHASLRINVNGTGNMVIYHRYEVAQNWETWNNLNISFYGNNTAQPVTFTFHTSSWQDYYSVTILDDFVGWKTVSVPLCEFKAYGNPSWSKIVYGEVLMGERVATYYLGYLRLEGCTAGISYELPSVSSDFSTLQIALSTRFDDLLTSAQIFLTSPYGQLEQTISDGVMIFDVQSELLKDGAVLTIYYPQNSAEQSLSLYYLGVL